MEMPAKIEKIVMIAVLRVLGSSLDKAASVLHIGKLTVMETEKWLSQATETDLEAVPGDAAIRRLVMREAPLLDELEADSLVRISTVTRDDILRHYGHSLRRPGVEADADLWKKHQRDVLRLVERLGGELDLSLAYFPVRNAHSGVTPGDPPSAIHRASFFKSPNTFSLAWRIGEDGNVSLCYPLEIEAEPKIGIVRGYLLQHLESSQLRWIVGDATKGLMRWGRLGGDELVGRAKLLQNLDRKVQKLIGKPLVDLNEQTVVGAGFFFSESIWNAVLDDRYRGLDYPPVEEIGTGLYKVQYGATYIGVVEGVEEGRKYQDYHRHLMAEFDQAGEVKAIRDLMKERASVTRSIQQELARPMADRLMPGKCACPNCRLPPVSDANGPEV